MTGARLQQGPHAAIVLALLALVVAAPVMAGDDAAKKAQGDTAARQATVPAEDPAGVLGSTSGEQVYQQICQGCHMPGGRGAVGAGAYPAFARNPRIASSRYMAVTILQGRRNMPSFARPHGDTGAFFPPTWLSDVQVANVINHIRTHFGNDFHDPITAEEVRALHP